MQPCCTVILPFFFPHGCLVCRGCLLTDVFLPLTNNYPCSPLQEAIRASSRVLLSHLTISFVQSPLIWVYLGICHAGKLAVTKRSTSRHIICYFGPGVWQIMATVWRSHWLQWLASYTENAEKPEWVIASLLNNNKRNNFVFSLQLEALKRETKKVMFGELFHWIDSRS